MCLLPCGIGVNGLLCSFSSANTCDSGVLSGFLQCEARLSDLKWFRPHGFTAVEVYSVLERKRYDTYVICKANSTIASYGMLRGWDDGFEVPSVGLIVSKTMRGKGIGKVMLQLLHRIAATQGAQKVRLTVDVDNFTAIRLYLAMGYLLEPLSNGRLVGFKSLCQPAKGL